ncbi:hypothetical protein HDU76_014039 [Blyttiomyces sp. JEL0837]|nr:hypothetical protein HDU76_014039 [Blyttiomyces sp. JEL0837]
MSGQQVQGVYESMSDNRVSVADKRLHAMDFLDAYIALCQSKGTYVIGSIRTLLKEAIDGGPLPKKMDLSGRNIAMKENRLTDDYMEILLTPLAASSFLHELDLSFNEIRNQGAIHLASFLRDDRFLRRLRLSSNSIESEGGCAIAKALIINDTLSLLDIGYNPLGDEAGIQFASMLQAFSKLVGGPFRTLEYGTDESKTKFHFQRAASAFNNGTGNGGDQPPPSEQSSPSSHSAGAMRLKIELCLALDIIIHSPFIVVMHWMWTIALAATSSRVRAVPISELYSLEKQNLEARDAYATLCQNVADSGIDCYDKSNYVTCLRGAPAARPQPVAPGTACCNRAIVFATDPSCGNSDSEVYTQPQPCAPGTVCCNNWCNHPYVCAASGTLGTGSSGSPSSGGYVAQTPAIVNNAVKASCSGVPDNNIVCPDQDHYRLIAQSAFASAPQIVAPGTACCNNAIVHRNDPSCRGTGTVPQYVPGPSSVSTVAAFSQVPPYAVNPPPATSAAAFTQVQPYAVTPPPATSAAAFTQVPVYTPPLATSQQAATSLVTVSNAVPTVPAYGTFTPPVDQPNPEVDTTSQTEDAGAHLSGGAAYSGGIRTSQVAPTDADYVSSQDSSTATSDYVPPQRPSVTSEYVPIATTDDSSTTAQIPQRPVYSQEIPVDNNAYYTSARTPERPVYTPNVPVDVYNPPPSPPVEQTTQAQIATTPVPVSTFDHYNTVSNIPIPNRPIYSTTAAPPVRSTSTARAITSVSRPVYVPPVPVTTSAARVVTSVSHPVYVPPVPVTTSAASVVTSVSHSVYTPLRTTSAVKVTTSASRPVYTQPVPVRSSSTVKVASSASKHTTISTPVRTYTPPVPVRSTSSPAGYTNVNAISTHVRQTSSVKTTTSAYVPPKVTTPVRTATPSAPSRSTSIPVVTYVSHAVSTSIRPVYSVQTSASAAVRPTTVSAVAPSSTPIVPYAVKQYNALPPVNLYSHEVYWDNKAIGVWNLGFNTWCSGDDAANHQFAKVNYVLFPVYSNGDQAGNAVFSSVPTLSYYSDAWLRIDVTVGDAAQTPYNFYTDFTTLNQTGFPTRVRGVYNYPVVPKGSTATIDPVAVDDYTAACKRYTPQSLQLHLGWYSGAQCWYFNLGQVRPSAWTGNDFAVGYAFVNPNLEITIDVVKESKKTKVTTVYSGFYRVGYWNGDLATCYEDATGPGLVFNDTLIWNAPTAYVGC